MDISHAAHRKVWVQEELQRQGAARPETQTRTDLGGGSLNLERETIAASFRSGLQEASRGRPAGKLPTDAPEVGRAHPELGSEQLGGGRPAPSERIAGGRIEGLLQGAAAPDIDLAAAHLPPLPRRS